MPLHMDDFDEKDSHKDDDLGPAVGRIIINSPVFCPECKVCMNVFGTPPTEKGNVEKIVIMCPSCNMGFILQVPDPPPPLFKLKKVKDEQAEFEDFGLPGDGEEIPPEDSE